MHLRKKQFFIGSVLILLTLTMAYGASRFWGGMRGFYLWEHISSKAHGGHYVTSDGVKIYFETFGSGEPVLVLHGGLACLVSMQRQIRALADKYFVIAPDSRAQGRSGDGSGPLTYAQIAKDTIRLLDELNIPATNIVGFSDGGIVGLELAMNYPQRVRRLVAIGANYDPDGQIAKPSENAEAPPLEGPCASVYQDPSAWPQRARKVLEMWRTQPNYTPAGLAAIRVPALIMAGEADAIRRSHTDDLAKAIRGSKEIIIEGGTHSVDNKFAVIDEDILNFLATPLDIPSGH
jgi:pimeloyl-ACP methyl ester carboxylesterase